MRAIGALLFGLMLTTAVAIAQGQSPQPVGTMSDLMVGMVHPAANDLLLVIHRGAPRTDKEWMAVQRSAAVLAEAGNVLMMPGRTRQGEWNKDAQMLVDAGAAAYKAARAKDMTALTAIDEPLNAACVQCH